MATESSIVLMFGPPCLAWSVTTHISYVYHSRKYQELYAALSDREKEKHMNDLVWNSTLGFIFKRDPLSRLQNRHMLWVMCVSCPVTLVVWGYSFGLARRFSEGAL